MITDEELNKMVKTVNLLRNNDGSQVYISMQEKVLSALIISDAIVEASINISLSIEKVTGRF